MVDALVHQAFHLLVVRGGNTGKFYPRSHSIQVNHLFGCDIALQKISLRLSSFQVSAGILVIAPI
jgi:hypothetical protein